MDDMRRRRREGERGRRSGDGSDLWQRQCAHAGCRGMGGLVEGKGRGQASLAGQSLSLSLSRSLYLSFLFFCLFIKRVQVGIDRDGVMGGDGDGATYRAKESCATLYEFSGASSWVGRSSMEESCYNIFFGGEGRRRAAS